LSRPSPNEERGLHNGWRAATSRKTRRCLGQVDHLLGDEYEHESVPAKARRSLFSVTLVWAGFPMIITGAMTGSILVLGMGFTHALTAMIVGNLIMLAYVGALGVLGTRRGVNFALLASVVFGRKGYVVASGLLSTLLLGWYAVQTGITGAVVSGTYGLSYVTMTVIAGLHYIGLVSIRRSWSSASGSPPTLPAPQRGPRSWRIRATTAPPACRWASA